MINFETVIFPIYGFMFGVNYWNSKMDENQDESEIFVEDQHCLQFMFLFFGVSFVWYTLK